MLLQASHVTPLLRRTYWLVCSAVGLLTLSAILTYEANHRDDHAVMSAFNRTRLARDVQILAVDREDRLRFLTPTSASAAQVDDERDRHTLLAKLDTLAASEVPFSAEDSVLRDVKARLMVWDAGLLARVPPAGAIASVPSAEETPVFHDVRARLGDLRRVGDLSFTSTLIRDRWLRIIRNGSVVAGILLVLAGLGAAHRQIVRQVTAVVESQQEVVDRLAAASEYRDDDTGRHTQRVGELAARIARAMGLPADQAETIRRAAALHDIGKIGIPDSILLKQGKLTPEELDVIRRHTLIGARILEGGRSVVVAAASRVARSHHEWWDGSGYPDRLAGTKIPVEARITAVADVFDAIRSRRPYRDAFALAVSLEEIQQGAGTHFDPTVVQAFFASRCYEGYPVEGGESQDAEVSPSPLRQLGALGAPSGEETIDAVCVPTRVPGRTALAHS